MSGDAELLIRVENRAGRITFNRPQALNALTDGMISHMDAALRAWRDDPAVRLVLVDAAGTRAFCAGGDIGELYRRGRAGDLDYGRRFWRDEYRLNAAIACYPKPYVAVMDGIVMGGGVGVSAHGSHRIVTERSLVAMPECAIGLVPDVGGSMLLARAPGRLGEYLAMTGHRMTAADAILAGFADAFVAGEALEGMKARLCETGDPEAIGAFAAEPPPGEMEALRPGIDAAFSGDTAREIVARLEASDEPWAQGALAAIDKGSPLSVACALALVRASREAGSIEEALKREYRFTFRAQDGGELLEGIRAAVIDKDRRPRWSPARISDLDEARAAAMLAPLGADEWREEEKA